jgi:hypothetical protein
MTTDDWVFWSGIGVMIIAPFVAASIFNYIDKIKAKKENK